MRFLMAAIREGGAVAQLTFVPSEDVSIGADPFVTLAHRAQERLRQLAPTVVATTFPPGRGSHPRAPTRSARRGRRAARRRLRHRAAHRGATAAASSSSSPAASPSRRRRARSPSDARRAGSLARLPAGARATTRRTATTTRPVVGDRRPRRPGRSASAVGGSGTRVAGSDRRHRRGVPRRGRVGPRPHAGALPVRGGRERPRSTGRATRCAACLTRRPATGYGRTDAHRASTTPLGDESVVWTDTYWSTTAADGYDTGLTVYHVVRVGRAVLLAYEYGEGNGSEETRALGPSPGRRQRKGDRPDGGLPMVSSSTRCRSATPSRSLRRWHRAVPARHDRWTRPRRRPPTASTIATSAPLRRAVVDRPCRRCTC